MEIYLIRHTTPAIEKGICYGSTDLELATTFDQEAMEVIKQLPNSFDKIYSSPLKRCRLLAEKIKKEPIIDERLKEFDFGDWELQKWDDIPKHEIQPWFDDWVHTKAKNGDSYQELYLRCKTFLEEIKLNKCSRIAVVAHAGVIRAMNAYITGLSLEKSFDMKLTYGGILKFNV